MLTHDPRFESSDVALVVGAGLGGLAAAMRLGAKGYRVTVIDRLDMPGGRGSAIHKGGHRFDLGPTIVTAPQEFRSLWAACGRNFDEDVSPIVEPNTISKAVRRAERAASPACRRSPPQASERRRRVGAVWGGSVWGPPRGVGAGPGGVLERSWGVLGEVLGGPGRAWAEKWRSGRALARF